MTSRTVDHMTSHNADSAQVGSAVRSGGGPGLVRSVVILTALAFAALAAVVLLGPNFPASVIAPTYDGWKVGGVDDCPTPNFDPAIEPHPTAWDCDASLAVWLAAAREGFDRRDPAHPPIARATLHYTATSTVNLASCCEIVVFELADGSIRAIGVAHLGVVHTRVTPVDYGPDR